MASKKYILTFDIGGTKISSALVDSNGVMINYKKKQLPKNCSPQLFLKMLLDLGEQVRSVKKIFAIGVASAGPLDSRNGILLNPTNLFKRKSHGRKIDLKKVLTHYFNCEVIFENDADAQALGALWIGNLKNKDNFILISLGTGVGISVVCDGKIIKSGNGMHPELSHIPLNIFEKTRKCGCGAYGCIEAYLGGSHFVNNISRIVKNKSLDGEQIINMTKAGHKT